MHDVAVLMTCFNRRDLTLRALRTLLDEQTDHGADLHVVLVDDGSTDGTGDAVRAVHGPDSVTVLRGSGDLFWSGGMRLAWWFAHTQLDVGSYVWCNDDVALRPDALATTLSTHAALEQRTDAPAIVVGSTDDPDTGEHTYGGVRRPAPVTRPLAFELVPPGPAPVQVETMNGQWVLVPSAVANLVGNLEARYSHAMGDYDYGLRAARKGVEIWLQPGHVGSCSRNPPRVPGQGGIGTELRELTDRRQLPLSDWQVFARRWGGPAWPLYWASPYLRRAGRVLAARLG